MKSKNILLIGHNFSPELVGMGKYNGEMIDWLVREGYDCTVITTFPYYPFWKVQAPYKNLWYKKEIKKDQNSNATLTIYRCPAYIPKDPTGKRRAVQDFSYWISKFALVAKLVASNKKFDLIITVAPPFHLAYLGLLVRKITGGKLLYHIQDLQIEAARDLKLFSNKRILTTLFRAERSILKNADHVSSISAGMIKKIKQKVDRDLIFFPNWVDTNTFYPLNNREQLKAKWNYLPDDIIFLYSGAIGVKQGLENLLKTAAELINENHIKFIICSSGPYKQLLQEEAEKKNLNNISFLPVQSKESFNEFLNLADIHLVIQKPNAGDLVMPSKLSTVLAVGGVSLVTASQGTSLFELVTENDFGFIVEPGNQMLLTQQITSIKLDDNWQSKRENAYNYAIKYLNQDKVMGDFVENILSK